MEQNKRSVNELFTTRELAEEAVKTEKNIFLCFVDLEKTSNLIGKGEIWKALKERGVQLELIQWIRMDTLCFT